jgi:hypothetical protein
MIQVKITNYSLFNDKFEIYAVKIQKIPQRDSNPEWMHMKHRISPYTTASMSDTVLISSGNVLHYESVVSIYHTQYNSNTAAIIFN